MLAHIGCLYCHGITHKLASCAAVHTHNPPRPCLHIAGIRRQHICQLAGSAEVLDQVRTGDGSLRWVVTGALAGLKNAS